MEEKQHGYRGGDTDHTHCHLYPRTAPPLLRAPAASLVFLQDVRCTFLGGENMTNNDLVRKGCQGVPGGSAGKDSACKAGDPTSIPGLGSSPG